MEPNAPSLPSPPPGYHDLYVKYLNGPMPFCERDDRDRPILSSCESGVPLESVVLPAGY